MAGRDEERSDAKLRRSVAAAPVDRDRDPRCLDPGGTRRTLLAPFSPGAIVSTESFAFVKDAGPLGTDYLGRDLLSRLVFAARGTLGFAFLTCLFAFLGWPRAGLPCGPLGRRRPDRPIAEPAGGSPDVLSGTHLGAGDPRYHRHRSTAAMLAIVSVIEATRVFRLARALGLDLSVADFVQVSRARGGGHAVDRWFSRSYRIALGRSRPSSAFAIPTRSFSSPRCHSSALGSSHPTADWGVMVQENIQGLLYGAPAALIPAFCITSVTVSIILLIDDLIAPSLSRIPRELIR